ncbi:MAG: polysaccharide biosynthesis protein, partial [Traorella sp.]
FASMVELRNLLYAVFTSSFIKLFLYVLVLHYSLPRSWYLLEPMFLILFSGGLRFIYRNIRSIRNRQPYIFRKNDDNINVMIIGAGEAGNLLLREMILSEHLQKRVVCLIDDDPRLKGRYMNGVPIVGTRNDIYACVKKYRIKEIYIALPSASAKDRSEIIDICKNTGCKMKILPGIYQMVNGEVSVSKLKNVEIEDLLGREPIRVDLQQIASYMKDKIIMVTGGGGSIGSELCRQIASNHPKQLIIVDIYENNAYAIQMELKSKYPDLNLQVRIASIRDEHKIDCLFHEFHPEVVFHAAAHKHVPLMEDSPNEAIKNNVFGTLNLVKAADKYQVKRFVQISTDKAVNPTNIMGATKRMCEMIIQTYANRSQTEFAAVRFGNVLGSNGSVIPLFKKQIAQGGPVTVTDKNIIRYFMTIPEAVSLVIQAGVYAKGGEIFVLDMGKPMKIDDLARNLIRLSGYVPDVDIPIVYTGLRPGEKLYEELLMSEEGLRKTDNTSVFIGQPIEFDEEEFLHQLDELKECVKNESNDIKNKVSEIVLTYKPWKN